MKKITFFSLFLMIISTRVFSDSPYKLDPATDIMLGCWSLALFTASQCIPPQVSGQGSTEDINGLDAQAMFLYNKTLDDIGTFAAYTALVLPAAGVFYEARVASRYVPYAVMYAEAFLLTWGSKDLLKALVCRYRPCAYVGSVPEDVAEDVYNSFPSGHTSFGFLGAAFLSSTFSREYPDSPWEMPLVVSAYTLAGGVAITRVLSGSHFITDILAGALIGSFWGWVVPELHCRGGRSGVGAALVPVPGGVLVSVQF